MISMHPQSELELAIALSNFEQTLFEYRGTAEWIDELHYFMWNKFPIGEYLNPDTGEIHGIWGGY